MHELLERAQKKVEKGNLIAPPGDNALEIYREVLEKDPDNSDALAALVKIKEHLATVVESFDTENGSSSAQEQAADNTSMAEVSQINADTESSGVRSRLISPLGIAAAVIPVMLVAAYFYFSDSDSINTDIKVADEALPKDNSVDPIDPVNPTIDIPATMEDPAVATQSETNFEFTSSVVPATQTDESENELAEAKIQADEIDKAGDENVDDVSIAAPMAEVAPVDDSVDVAATDTTYPADADATADTSVVADSVSEEPENELAEVKNPADKINKDSEENVDDVSIAAPMAEVTPVDDSVDVAVTDTTYPADVDATADTSVVADSVSEEPENELAEVKNPADKINKDSEENIDDVSTTGRKVKVDTVDDSANVAATETTFSADTGATVDTSGKVESTTSSGSILAITESSSDSPDATEAVTEPVTDQINGTGEYDREPDFELPSDVPLEMSIAQSVVTQNVMEPVPTNESTGESTDVVVYPYDSGEILQSPDLSTSDLQVVETEQSEIAINDAENTDVYDEESLEQILTGAHEKDGEDADIVSSESESLPGNNNETPDSIEPVQAVDASATKAEQVSVEPTRDNENSDEIENSQDIQIAQAEDDATSERVEEIVIAVLEKEKSKEVDVNEITGEQTDALLDETQRDSAAGVEDETRRLEEGVDRSVFAVDPRSAELIAAVKFNQLETIDDLIGSGVSINAADENGDNALIYAAWDGKNDTIRFLLDRGANLNHKNNIGWNALLSAVTAGHIETVKVLLAEGADVHFTTMGGKSVLMAAARNQRPEIVKLLLRSGAKINQVNNDGWSALFYAVWYGFEDIVSILMENGADLSIRDHVGNSVTNVANNRGHSKLLKLLVDSA